jgi:hypothetical protein
MSEIDDLRARVDALEREIYVLRMGLQSTTNVTLAGMSAMMPSAPDTDERFEKLQAAIDALRGYDNLLRPIGKKVDE